jgi:hypothetical protein
MKTFVNGKSEEIWGVNWIIMLYGRGIGTEAADDYVCLFAGWLIEVACVKCCPMITPNSIFLER